MDTPNYGLLNNIFLHQTILCYNWYGLATEPTAKSWRDYLKQCCPCWSPSGNQAQHENTAENSFPDVFNCCCFMLYWMYFSIHDLCSDMHLIQNAAELIYINFFNTSRIKQQQLNTSGKLFSQYFRAELDCHWEINRATLFQVISPGFCCRLSSQSISIVAQIVWCKNILFNKP